MWSINRDRSNMKRPHHFIVFMLNNMTMPDIIASKVKLHFDSSNFTRIGNDSVFKTGLPRHGSIRSTTEWLSIHNLEFY